MRSAAPGPASDPSPGRRTRWLTLGVTAFVAVLGLNLRRPAPAGADGDALPPARHEKTDVAIRPAMLGGVLMLAALAGVVGLTSWLYPGSPGDGVVQLPLPEFPAPRLQTNTAADMEAFRAAQLRQLTTAWWVDRERGVVHLPIDQAMRAVARDGIPDWPTQPQVSARSPAAQAVAR